MPTDRRLPALRPGGEAVAAYRLVYQRIDALLRERAQIAELPVPACPAWTVRQTLAHLTGLAQDIVSFNLEGIGTEAWTRAQVDRLAGKTVDELLDLWSEAIDMVIERVGQDGLEAPAAQLVFDSLTHEYDIRGALGQPGTRTEDPAFAVALEFLMMRFDGMARQNGVLTLMLNTPTTGSVQLGEPATATDRLALSISDFEALRAFGGRRSVQQLSALPWHGDPGDLLPTLGNESIRPPRNDLIE
ncbi:maleylpyruvate isomerase N-terminal domain-containing protein [Mycobacteroides chelonae]